MICYTSSISDHNSTKFDLLLQLFNLKAIESFRYYFKMTRLYMLVLTTFALAILIQVNQATKDPKTVCYYESWVHWRHGDGKMDPDEIGKYY